jgi:UDP-N-acetylmuramoyl-tripeptide--D-alanyl-D-alanine ligase
MKKIANLYKLFKKSRGVSTDTREDLKGKIFFALSGENFDGNKFAKKALEQGALAAVIDNDQYLINNCILVEDSLTTLQTLAKSFARDLTVPIFGITGSNGKTTSKELIRSIISTKFKIHATKGNLNNHIGVPLTILSCPLDTEFLLIEMGANHRFEIKELCEIAQPQFGTITNVGRAHLEGFGSFENIIKTKTELYQYLDLKKGLLFVNASDKILVKEIPAGSKALVYSLSGTLSDNRRYNFSEISNKPLVSFKLELDNDTVNIQSNLLGDFNFLNLQLAAIIGMFFGIDLKSIKLGIENYTPKNNRTEIRKLQSNTLILDAYNANPSSMKESIKSFAGISSKRVLILGDMKELGSFSFQEHYDLIQFIKSYKWEQIYLVGEEFCKSNSHKDIQCFENVDKLKTILDFNAFENSHFLLKGSRSMKLEKLLE